MTLRGSALYEGQPDPGSGITAFWAIDSASAQRSAALWARFERYCQKYERQALPASANQVLNFIMQVHFDGDTLPLPMMLGAISRQHHVRELPASSAFTGSG